MGIFKKRNIVECNQLSSTLVSNFHDLNKGENVFITLYHVGFLSLAPTNREVKEDGDDGSWYTSLVKNVSVLSSKNDANVIIVINTRNSEIKLSAPNSNETFNFVATLRKNIYERNLCA